MRRTTIGLLTILVFTGLLGAAEPPDYVNYQGVLRDADGHALDGEYDMEFHFFDSMFGGSRLLTDRHASIDPAGAVTVTGGLFNVHLGEGTIDPGTYSTLGEAFGDRNEVWLEIEIGGEVLAPRIRVVAAPYALNAGQLDGRRAGGFLDTSPNLQVKAGGLMILSPAGPGLESHGAGAGGYFADSDASGYAYVGFHDRGIEARGSEMGGYFGAINQSGHAMLGIGNVGIEAYGTLAGGYFKDSNESGAAFVGVNDWGIDASGTTFGGQFRDSDDSGYAWVGIADRGIDARGSNAGGFFMDTDSSGYAVVGSGDRGIAAYGGEAGGYFEDTNGSGYAYVGYGDRGIEAQGSEMGGRFRDSDDTGEVRLGVGDMGVQAWGHFAAGYFSNLVDTGQAFIAIGDRGIEAIGTEMGGYFEDTDHSGFARVGYGDKGLEAFGSYMGGYFKDTDDLSDAKLALGGYGIQAFGASVGGKFQSLSSGNWADLGGSTFKIIGNGANPSFMQNHPERADRVIVYAAPEGNEIATYTRGTARLVAGEARVRLDETFGWVTNPDIGLSAHLTPRGECNGLYVDSLSTEELVVRELGDGVGDVIFDYIVWGLRVGFEELPVVQEKGHDAYLPRLDEALAVYDGLPELRSYSALERFKAMRSANGETEELDLSASLALRSAIGTYDPAIHGVDALETPLPDSPQAVGTIDDRGARGEVLRGDVPRRYAAGTVAGENLPEAEDESAPNTRVQYPASEPIAAGDLLVLDPDRPGYLRRAAGAADPAIFGIAAGESEVVDGRPRVELVESRYAEVKADASYGAILPGDLLVSSPTAGHVMRAIVPLPGTIVGKAAERLDAETGVIRVLVMLR